MPITYPAAVKQARMTAVVTSIGSTGVLEIGTAGMAAILATIPLNATAGTASGGTLTMSGFPKNDAADAAGTAAAARIRTATGGTDIITGLTVGTTGTDIILDNTSINAGQTVTITSAVFNHA